MVVKEKKFLENTPYNNRGDLYFKPIKKFLKFGTSGVRWLVPGADKLLKKEKIEYYISNGYVRTLNSRETLAEDFIMPNVGIVIKSIAQYILENGHPQKGVVVTYDNRPDNFIYAEEAVKILAAYGIKSLLAKSGGKFVPTPLPAGSRLVQKRGLAGHIMFTASHNGDEWNGIKFESEDGGAASPKITDVIGAVLSREIAIDDPKKPVAYNAATDDLEGLIKDKKVEIVDTLEFYADELSKYLNIEAIKKAVKEAKVEFIYSAFFGSSGPAIVNLFKKMGLPTHNIIETEKSVSQEYVASYEPTLGKLKLLMEMVGKRGREIKKKNLNTVVIGGAADNDADRFQVNQYNKYSDTVEEYQPEKLSAILGHYLCRYKGLKGPFGRSFVTGSLQDEVAKLFGLDTIETPTGFKFAPEKVFARGGVLFTEESYGLSFKGWTFDKDGILPSLLALEVVAATGKGLDEYYRMILDELAARGLRTRVFFKRYDMALDSGVKEKAVKSFTDFYNAIKADNTEFAGQIVKHKYDPKEFDGGLKFVLAGGNWVAFRSSGTEPVIRLYVEAADEKENSALAQAARCLMGLS